MEKKEKVSLWKLIGWLKKEGKIDASVFYEEVQINGQLQMSGIDEKLEQIIWKIDSRLYPALKETRYIYFKYENEVYILTVIAYDKNEVATSFPTLAIDKKLNRAYVRVKISEKDPVVVNIGEEEFLADDISEAGLGIITDKNKASKVEVGREYEIVLSLKGDIIKLKGIIVYRRKVGRDIERIGIRFTDIKTKDQDKIAKYIMDRQREIAKKIHMFR